MNEMQVGSSECGVRNDVGGMRNDSVGNALSGVPALDDVRPACGRVSPRPDPEPSPRRIFDRRDSATCADDPRIGTALADYAAALDAGRAIDRDDFLSRHAAIAEPLAECLDGLEFIHGAAAQVHNDNHDVAEPFAGLPATMALGDFRIIREIGRGGMGVVYEAEQLSLARRVALKVLPFASMLDPRHLQRFKNEALAAASLKHPNIVSVYCVGCERGVHFYAMEYVEGQTLAAIISECGDLSPLALSNNATHRKDVDENLTSTKIQSDDKSSHTKDTVVAALSTLRTDRPKEFFRTVAELGIQAAEALDHAHQMGILHRDIKPSNLMIESVVSGQSSVSSDGQQTTDNGQRTSPKLYITDFGLARIETDATLTLTGDLLGTLRYMSPEQAEGRIAILDHRTDIYSLGITLYELLTLRPAFPATDRQTLVHQIANDEPSLPRKLNQAIPAEFETIVLKAASKDRADRYQSASALADDLRRWLDSKPIFARPPTGWQRVAKWSRRNSTILATWTAVLTVTLIVVAAALVWVAQAYQEKTLESARASANLRQTHEVIDRLLTRVAENRLLKAPHMDELRKTLLLDALDANSTLLMANEESPAARYELARAHLRASEILRDLGDETKSVEHAKEGLALAEALYAADASEHHQLLLAQSYHRVARTTSPRLMAEAVALIESLVEAHPQSEVYRLKLARGYNDLAVCMIQASRPEEAIELYRKSIAIAPNIAQFHTNLAGLLAIRNRHDEAAEELRVAIRLGDHTDPHLIPWSRYTLGCVLDQMGRGEEARAELRTALGEIDAIVRDHPRVTEWRRQQAYNLITLSECTPSADLPEAIALGKRAVAAIEELLRQSKENPADQQLLEIAQKNLMSWEKRAAKNGGKE